MRGRLKRIEERDRTTPGGDGDRKSASDGGSHAAEVGVMHDE
jgi:hypothetical protein